MKRPTIDETLMDIAYIMGKRGTCTRMQVGTVIARDGRILTTGYNGAPTGMKHCTHINATSNADSPGCTSAVHAEANAIAFAARHGISLNNAALYTTMSPCLDCAKLIVNAGICYVMSGQAYRTSEGEQLIHAANIPLEILPKE